MKNHKDSLSGIAISENIEKAASCGDNTVKIHELHDLKDTANVITLDDERGLDQMEWSEDGQLLAVSTTKGTFFKSFKDIDGDLFYKIFNVFTYIFILYFILILKF